MDKGNESYVQLILNKLIAIQTYNNFIIYRFLLILYHIVQSIFYAYIFISIIHKIL